MRLKCFLLLLLLGAPCEAGTTAASRDRAAAIVDMRRAGQCPAEIARELRITRRRVQSVLAGAGLVRQLLPEHPNLANVVRFEAARHGANYGWTMLLGALRAHYPGWGFPRRAVYTVLRQCNPRAAAARANWATRRLDRGMYHAPHFFYSLHIDLACKLQEYGLYAGAALDGCTRKVVSLVALTDKMPVTIYEQMLVPIALEFGLPDQLLSDKGSEWAVCAFTCTFLAIVAGRRWRRAPYRMVKSERNVRFRAHALHALRSALAHPDT